MVRGREEGKVRGGGESALSGVVSRGAAELMSLFTAMSKVRGISGAYCWWSFAAALTIFVIHDAKAVDVHAILVDDFGDSVEEDGTLKTVFAD